MMEEKISRIFQKIKKDEVFKRRFFKKLSQTENPYPWFELLQERGYLNPSNNKNPKIEGDNYYTPYWQVLDYLENVARHLFKNPNEEILSELLGIINSIIDYKEDGRRVENPHTDWMLLKTIFKLPVECITEKHVNFIEIALLSRWSNTVLISAEIEKTIFPFLIKNESKQLLLKLLKIIIKPKKNGGNYLSEKTSIMDDYWFAQTIKNNKKKFIEICGLDSARILINQIKAILEENESRFNIVTIPAIEDNSQTMFPDRYECQIVYLLRDTLEQARLGLPKDLLEELLESFPILKRIGVYIINRNYSAFSSLFWSWKGNPLAEIELTHEIYELLNLHYETFTEDQFDRLIKWIEGLSYEPPKKSDRDTADIKKIEARKRRRWLSSVINSNNPTIKKLEKKYYQISPEEIEHPSFIYWSSGVSMVPLEAEPFPKELLDRTNQRIADYINNYQPEDRKSFPLKGSFTESFYRAVLDNYQKFTTDMLSFLSIPLEYQYSLLSGVHEAWNIGKEFSWQELFDYILRLISNPIFWVQGNKAEENNKQMIIRKIGDLIINGTSKDDHAFDADNFPTCEKVLLILGNQTKSDLDSNIEDIIQAVLNSSLGTIYSAMIIYSLRFARFHKIKEDVKWITSIKEHFDKQLTKSKRLVEFDVSLGKYLLNLDFLDKTWVEDNINRIFLKENVESWRNAFSSYLLYTTTLSKRLYVLLRENQHYHLALRTKFENPQATRKLSQLICIAYLNDFESLSPNSLMMGVIAHENTDHLSELVRFIWRLRDKINEDITKKIPLLWKAIVDFVGNLEDSSKYYDILANLSYWLSLVDTIDDSIFQWVIFSAQYITRRTEWFFTESLSEHVKKTPKFVGEIIYRLIKSRNYFLENKKENIVKIVEKLYEFEQTDLANRICNLYLDNGYDFLIEVYENYNPSK